MTEAETEQATPEGPLTEKQLNALLAPLNTNRIAKRRQGNTDLSYLEAWDVKATLIRMFGFGGFSAEVLDTRVIEINRTDDGNNKPKVEACAMVTLRLSIHSLGCVYTESAVASQTGRDVGEVLDFAVKTAESDALKRAAIYLGTQFGLSLYDSGSTRDVVRVILAPGQERSPAAAPTNPEAEALLASKLGAQATDQPA